MNNRFVLHIITGITILMVGLVFLNQKDRVYEELPVDFSINATTDASFEGFNSMTSISPNGDFQYMKWNPYKNVITEEFSGKLSLSEMDELYGVVKNNFFNLPRDLTTQAKCYDAATAYITVTAFGKMYKKGGYCIQNEAFFNVGRKLQEYYEQFKPEQLRNISVNHSSRIIEIYQYQTLQIHDIRQMHLAPGIYGTEGFVVKVYTCPVCPRGIFCKPCMKDNIVISENNKLLESYELTEQELIVFTSNPNQFELGKRYEFVVKSIDGSSGTVELIRYNKVK